MSHHKASHSNNKNMQEEEFPSVGRSNSSSKPRKAQKYKNLVCIFLEYHHENNLPRRQSKEKVVDLLAPSLSLAPLTRRVEISHQSV